MDGLRRVGEWSEADRVLLHEYLDATCDWDMDRLTEAHLDAWQRFATFAYEKIAAEIGAEELGVRAHELMERIIQQ